ncbi:MAG: ATP-binding cassette domain-containing protein [Bacteroidales bacterium]|nr:ATP-binding cassette domain-containing protein [Bacteroidales bacterium]
MEIKFSEVIPAPIPEKDILQSEIWSRDLTFNDGKKYLIYADSGKGKTTFINIIFGLRKDYSGTVLINGQDIRNFNLNNLSELHKNALSIVPQGLFLFPELTMIENIIIKNRLQNHFSASRINEMIETLGLKGFENRKAGKMSFGQRQRVAIIRALCQNFDFILLDEAFSHLDNKNTKIAWELINEEADKQNAGIILTSLHEDFENELIKLRV